MNDLINRQAAIDALGDRPEVWTDSDYEIAQRNQYDADRLAIETVPSAQQWIPVTERSPDSTQLVIVTLADGEVCAEIYWGNRIGWLSDNVVAWMPLPEPYKEAQP